MTTLFYVAETINAALRLDHSLRITFKINQPIFKIVLTPQKEEFELDLQFEAINPRYNEIVKALTKVFNSPRSGSIDRDYDYIRKNGY